MHVSPLNTDHESRNCYEFLGKRRRLRSRKACAEQVHVALAHSLVAHGCSVMMMASSLWKVAFAGQEGAEGVDHPSQRHPE